jgi:nucleotide-binding universal stress UspA family protein
MKTESLEPVGSRLAMAAPEDGVSEMAPINIHLKNILVPLDFSETSLKALQYAVPFAKQFGAKLTLVHVVEPLAFTPELAVPAPLGGEHLAAVQAQLAEIRTKRIPEDLPVKTIVRHNFIFDGILEAARETSADLIITSTHGLTGLRHLLMGSTAENIVRRAPCPVLVVRECEHEFV